MIGQRCRFDKWLLLEGEIEHLVEMQLKWWEWVSEASGSALHITSVPGPEEGPQEVVLGHRSEEAKCRLVGLHLPVHHIYNSENGRLIHFKFQDEWIAPFSSFCVLHRNNKMDLKHDLLLIPQMHYMGQNWAHSSTANPTHSSTSNPHVDLQVILHVAL